MEPKEIAGTAIGQQMLIKIGVPLSSGDLNSNVKVSTLLPHEGLSMSDPISSKDYIDRSMDAVRAQNDARFAEVLYEMKSLRGLIEGKPSTWQMVGAVFAGAATILAVMLAALAYGSDRFDGGVGLADQRQEQLQRDAAQDAVLRRLDALLAAQSTPALQAPESPSE